MSTPTTQDGNNLNQLQSKKRVSKSRYDIRPDLALTARFGEITPFLVTNGLPSDHLEFRSQMDLRTFTLKSPLMQNIKMYRTYFSVPMRCILPNNWDKIYVNPNLGDDVPQNAFCSVSRYSLLNLFHSMMNYQITDKKTLYIALSYVALFEQVFSSGSLSNILGLPLPCFDGVIKTDNFAKLVDLISADLSFRQLTVYDQSFENVLFYLDTSKVPSHSLAQYFLDYPCLPTDYTDAVLADIVPPITTLINALCGPIQAYLANPSSAEKDIYIDLSRLWAYQLVYHHFYTNDKVDFIYSADTFRSYIGGLIGSNTGLASFDWNGQRLVYDYLSAYYFPTSINISTIQYLCALFPFRRSLRYLDYFTSARTRPLAVGNTAVSVNAGNVDVVDISRSIQMQKFLNQVNRTGRKLSNYVKGLFGEDLGKYDGHDPQWLAQTEDVVYGTETENTAFSENDPANNIRTNLRVNSNKYGFSFDVDDSECIILGLMHFDVVRFYSKGFDRQTLRKDRFDFFNPTLQFIGDQKIYSLEVDRSRTVPSQESLSAYGYTTRYMEYRQAFPRAVGGFVDNLPSWLFDDKMLPSSEAVNITPEVIRSLSSQLDQFYLSLTGNTINDYFHFICLVSNYLSATRPVAVNPQILG